MVDIHRHHHRDRPDPDPRKCSNLPILFRERATDRRFHHFHEIHLLPPHHLPGPHEMDQSSHHRRRSHFLFYRVQRTK